ncbi:hypothetical protein V7148_15795 [Gottfriedia acidiceleris]|uniref:hypothetical protein n=1 Tax=Bacillaceae TaxID=186817 RepID=UPI000BECB1F9|nr:MULTISPECIES: hypothetical protein [unclassified Bacillus (in: firmicutes)]PEC50651.1 hypothetical protein CON00_05355 [Bacillus sp. AFS096315]PFM76855.1 hypothetical protein COJ46_19310 [Bacillus sp. AFS077874]
MKRLGLALIFVVSILSSCSNQDKTEKVILTGENDNWNVKYTALYIHGEKTLTGKDILQIEYKKSGMDLFNAHTYQLTLNIAGNTTQLKDTMSQPIFDTKKIEIRTNSIRDARSNETAKISLVLGDNKEETIILKSKK